MAISDTGSSADGQGRRGVLDPPGALGEARQLGDIAARLAPDGKRIALIRKGGAGWAVGIAIRDVIHAVLLNKKALLPVSSLIQGAYDIRDICLSVPSVVGRGGVQKHVEIKLWPKELMALQASARALKDTLAKVKA